MSNIVMQTDSLQSFTLVKYELSSIVLIQKNTNKAYQYQINQDCLELGMNIHRNICHKYLLRPIVWRNGMLYAKGCENLGSLVEARRRDYRMERFSDVEVANTFEPILECLGYLHSQGITYSRITAQHIVFFENGEIFLKDWLFNPNLPNSTFSESFTQKLLQGSVKQNLKQLGMLIVESATLIPLEQLLLLSSGEMASMLLQFYGIEFVIGVFILVQGLVEYYDRVLGMMQGRNNYVEGNIPIVELRHILLDGIQIKNLREKQRQKMVEQKSIKIKLLQVVENQKIKVETPLKNQQKQLQNGNQCDSFQISPTKKFNITTPNRKIIRLQDTQNKKILNQQVKKRQIQKITKIIQRSNAFVNQLMARKNGDKKYLGNIKGNVSVFDVQENCVKKIGISKDSPKIGSPTKRLRSISKKK